MKKFSSDIVKKVLAQTKNVVGRLPKISLRNIPWKSPKVIGGVLALTLLVGSGLYYLKSTAPAVVIINGETVGVVANVQSGKKLVDKVLAEKGASWGVPAKTHDRIEYKPVRIGDNEYKTLSKEELEKKLSVYIDGVELRVNDKPIFVLPTKEDVDKLLKAYQDIYVQKSDANQITSVSFAEKVEQLAIEAPPEKVVTFDKALEELKKGDVQKQEYVVQPNDSWWLIARKNDMKTMEVLAGNPGATEDTKLDVGQKINIVKVVPYLTVVSEGVRTEKETVPFDVVTKTDASLPSGQTKIVQAGSDGEKEVKYSYVQKNDKVISKTVLDEKVLKEPIDQVVAKGPNQSPVVVASSRGSGQVAGMIWPLRGRINSYYGYRGGEFHSGLDINGYQGDPFVAAAAGKVVSAGWNGNYGLSIVIDHGNGIMTRYAHASKLLVSSGQSVSKGQTIGLVGSTGRSTGPHLHFEVIVNGDTTNPLRYLP